MVVVCLRSSRYLHEQAGQALCPGGWQPFDLKEAVGCRRLRICCRVEFCSEVSQVVRCLIEELSAVCFDLYQGGEGLLFGPVVEG